MCASVSDEVTTVIDDATKVIPVNAEPPGRNPQTDKSDIRTSRTKPTGTKPKASASLPVVKAANMGNQQGSDSPKKKGKKENSQKPSSPNADDGSRSSKSPSLKAKSSPASPSKKVFKRKQQSEKQEKAHEKGSATQGASATDRHSAQDVFADAKDTMESGETSGLLKSEKTVCDESSDNISFESVSCATPLRVATPCTKRAMPTAAETQDPPAASPNPVHRVDELGKSIERAIMERFSDNASISLEEGSQLCAPDSHLIAPSQRQPSTTSGHAQVAESDPEKATDSYIADVQESCLPSQPSSDQPETSPLAEEAIDPQSKVKPIRKIKIVSEEDGSKSTGNTQAAKCDSTDKPDCVSEEVTCSADRRSGKAPPDGKHAAHVTENQEVLTTQSKLETDQSDTTQCNRNDTSLESASHPFIALSPPTTESKTLQQSNAVSSSAEIDQQEKSTLLTDHGEHQVDGSSHPERKTNSAVAVSQEGITQTASETPRLVSQQPDPIDSNPVDNNQESTKLPSQSVHEEQLKPVDVLAGTHGAEDSRDAETVTKSAKDSNNVKTQTTASSADDNKSSQNMEATLDAGKELQLESVTNSAQIHSKDPNVSQDVICEPTSALAGDTVADEAIASELRESEHELSVETPTEKQETLASLFISEPDIIKPGEIKPDEEIEFESTPPVRETTILTRSPDRTLGKAGDVQSEQMSALDIAAALKPASRSLTLAEKRRHRLTDPLVDTLLLLIKQTMESDDVDQGGITPTPKTAPCLSGPSKRAPRWGQPAQTGKPLPKDDVVEEEDFIKTLTTDDMAEFNQLKKALPLEESGDVGEMDDDTLTSEDLVEFDRLKKELAKSARKSDIQSGNEQAFPLQVEDRFELSSGETTEDSVIERPTKRAPVLAATQEEEGNGSSIEVKQAVPREPFAQGESPTVDVPAPGESHDVSKPESPTLKKHSLTEEEIRREIRKFMIPEMKESLPMEGSMKQMLNDLHDITPTSELYPGLDDGESSTSPEPGNSSGVRSRTSITSSELDISEQRDDVSTGTDSMYADDEDDSSSEVLFCKTYTEPVRGAEVLVSCTVVNSAVKDANSSSDEFWAENSAPEDAYQQLEFAAAAVNHHFTHARSQMQDIQHHLQALKYQMQDMEKQVGKTSLEATNEFDFDDPERRAVTD